ncbi:MAG: hypothetical protein DRP63_06145, partial [Planctomycetota bacterium]
MVKMRSAKVVAVMVTVAVIAVGCSSRKRKKHTHQSLQITTASLPDATEGDSYSATIEATGGTTPYTWTVSGLPSGLSWSQVGDSVEISGTPASGTAGTYNIDVTVSDSSAPTQSVSATLQLVVNPAGSSGTTWYVDAVNGSDSNSGSSWSDAFATIGKALSVADDYDLVLVADATYNETDLNFGGRRIHLKGVDYHSGGLTQPVIDCQGNGRAFYFGSGETKDSVIDNFTIQNGKVTSDYGGAIFCENISSPTITNCSFSGNSADWGGAIWCDNFSSPTITNCSFSGNSATGVDSYGGAICCSFCSNPTVSNCTFGGNNADWGGAICCKSDSSPTVTNCTFSSNNTSYDGGAIFCWNNSSPKVTNCVLSGNSAGQYGGAIYCASSSPTLNNCILWGNSASIVGNEVYVGSGSCNLNYCCVDNAGYGGVTSNITENNCIHQDPQFVDPANGDYHLQDTSPCIDAGDNSYVPTG